MALYSDTVMEHFRHPRNVGVIEDADGVGEVGNAKCGDIMKIYLKIDDDVVTEAMELTNKAVAEALDGLPAHKLHCSVLAEEAVKKALEDYYRRRGIEYNPACMESDACPVSYGAQG